MNTFRQHIPGFAFNPRDEPPPIFEFSTTEELLAIPAVSQFSKGKDFSHFAKSDNCIMAISDNGFHWWVVGRVADPLSVDLPFWEGGKYYAELPDGSHTILSSKEVVSSCANILTLRDGTKANNLKSAQIFKNT